MQKEEDCVDYVDVVKFVWEVKVVCIICCGVKEVLELFFYSFGFDFLVCVLSLQMFMEEFLVRVFIGFFLVEVRDLESIFG